MTGRAAVARQASSLQQACANLYSRGKAAMERELRLRFQAISLVREFVGSREWSEAVPVQGDGPPSFEFMFGRAPIVSAGDAGSDADDG